MSLVPIAVSLVIAATVLAPVGAQDAGLPLEELRQLARSQVGGMKQEFEDTLQGAVKIFQASGPDSTSRRVVKAREELAPWAQVFSSEIVAVIEKHANANLRHHLVEVLVTAEDPSVAPALAQVLGKAGVDFDITLVEALARLENPAVAPRIRGLISDTASPRLVGEALLALASLRASDAGELARRYLNHADAALRIQAVRALARSRSQPKEDADLLIAVIRDDEESKVRIEALRALGAYPEDLDVLRVLHDTVTGKVEVFAVAALDALESVASRDYSGNYLYKAVQSEFPVAFREKAARIMVGLGNTKGVKLLVKPLQKEAERKPKDRPLQRQVADEYKRLGDYEDAINYYKRGIDPRGSGTSQFTTYVDLARCQAALEKFADARKSLLKAGYRDFSRFTDDPFFKKMSKEPEFAELFEAR